MFAVDVASQAGAVLAEPRGRSGVEYKDAVEPVTEADRQSDKLTTDTILNTYPRPRRLAQRQPDPAKRTTGPTPFSGQYWVPAP